MAPCSLRTDFVYVPIDFSTRRSSNMGYAFVNLTTPQAARQLHDALHGCRWKTGSSKVIEVCPALIQGKNALVRHFRGSTFACHSDEYLSAVFSPPPTPPPPSPSTSAAAFLRRRSRPGGPVRADQAC